MKFIYRNEAEVYYDIPKTVKDYLKQNTRFSGAINNMKTFFWKKIVEKEIFISKKNKIKSLIFNFIKRPFDWLIWIVLFSYWKVFFKLNKNKINSSWKWDISNTTK